MVSLTFGAGHLRITRGGGRAGADRSLLVYLTLGTRGAGSWAGVGTAPPLAPLGGATVTVGATGLANATDGPVGGTTHFSRYRR